MGYKYSQSATLNRFMRLSKKYLFNQNRTLMTLITTDLPLPAGRFSRIIKRLNYFWDSLILLRFIINSAIVNHPASVNREIGFAKRIQNVFKTYSKRIQNVFKTYSKRIQNVFKTYSGRFYNLPEYWF